MQKITSSIFKRNERFFFFLFSCQFSLQRMKKKNTKHRVCVCAHVALINRKRKYFTIHRISEKSNVNYLLIRVLNQAHKNIHIFFLSIYRRNFISHERFMYLTLISYLSVLFKFLALQHRFRCI
jgi:hypothetical protein